MELARKTDEIKRLREQLSAAVAGAGAGGSHQRAAALPPLPRGATPPGSQQLPTTSGRCGPDASLQRRCGADGSGRDGRAVTSSSQPQSWRYSSSSLLAGGGGREEEEEEEEQAGAAGPQHRRSASPATDHRRPVMEREEPYKKRQRTDGGGADAAGGNLSGGRGGGGGGHQPLRQHRSASDSRDGDYRGKPLSAERDSRRDEGRSAGGGGAAAAASAHHHHGQHSYGYHDAWRTRPP